MRESDASKREGVGPTLFLAVRKRHSQHLLLLGESCSADATPALSMHQSPFFTGGIPCRLFHDLPGVLPLNLDWDRFRGDW